MNKKSCYIFAFDNLELNNDIKKQIIYNIEKLVTIKKVTHFIFNKNNALSQYCLSILKKLISFNNQIETTLVENSFNFNIIKNELFDRFDLYEIANIEIEHYYKHEYLKHKNYFIIDKCEFVFFVTSPVITLESTFAYSYAKKTKNCNILLLN